MFRPDAEHPREQSRDAVRNVVDAVAKRVRQVVRDGHIPVILGGDCTITIGVLAGLVPTYPRLGMIYLDGDLDLNTPDVTPSGFFDGMVLAHIIGDGVASLSHVGPQFPLIPEERIAVFGFNDAAGGVDPYEIRRLARSALRSFPVDDVRLDPVGSAVRALTTLSPAIDHFIVHFDVDVIDERDMPAVDVRHANSLSIDEVTEVLRVFVRSPKWTGLVITEFNAALDASGIATARLVSALSSVFA